jgi:hypothetical protein
MKVYVGYQCEYDYCNEWRDAVKVFSSIEKAEVWKKEFKSTRTEWRSYTEMDIE